MWVGTFMRVKRSAAAPEYHRSYRKTGAGPETAPAIVLESRRDPRWRPNRVHERRRARERWTALLVVLCAAILAGGMVLAAL